MTLPTGPFLLVQYHHGRYGPEPCVAGLIALDNERARTHRSMEQYDDELDLIKRAGSGDKTAFETLVRRYQDKVYNICRYVLGNASDAEDAAQDVFIKAYRNLSSFTPSPGFSAWISRIAVNTSLDYRRRPAHESIERKSSEGEEYTHDAAFAGPGPEETFASKESGLAVTAALGRLSEKYRVVMVLKELEGFSYEEISFALDISIGTVKSRISRAREELKRILSGSMEQ